MVEHQIEDERLLKAEARRAAFDEAIAALQKRYEAYLGVNAITAHEVSQCIVALQFARDGEQDREGR